MTLEDYIKKLQLIVKENPEAANLIVVYAKDDEGNGYEEIHYYPILGYYDEDDREFSPEPFDDEDKPNSICVN